MNNLCHDCVGQMWKCPHRMVHGGFYRDFEPSVGRPHAFLPTFWDSPVAPFREGWTELNEWNQEGEMRHRYSRVGNGMHNLQEVTLYVATGSRGLSFCFSSNSFAVFVYLRMGTLSPSFLSFHGDQNRSCTGWRLQLCGSPHSRPAKQWVERPWGSLSHFGLVMGKAWTLFLPEKLAKGVEPDLILFLLCIRILSLTFSFQ